MAFVLDHAEVRFAVAEYQEQVDNLVSIKERGPRMKGRRWSELRVGGEDEG